jgi:choline dehydrogenase-like flavoprotein
LGRYFSDHLSVCVGTLQVQDWNRLNHAIAPVFLRGLMRTPRMELSASAQRSGNLTSAFAHFTFQTDGSTGFDIVRNWLRKRQGEGIPLGVTPAMALKALRDTASLVYWKVAHRRLWIPRASHLMLQVDIEQSPNQESRLFLADAVDHFGRRRLAIDWRILPVDQHVIRVVAELMAKAWSSSPLASTAALVLTRRDGMDEFSTPYDVYHPTGTIRMGTHPTNSVVDGKLRVWSFANLFVSSTAVFPSAGSANPGYTHLALTSRLARHIAARG